MPADRDNDGYSTSPESPHSQTPRLPLEVIEDIIHLVYNPASKHPSYTPTLLSCALTCRTLRDLSLSLLYAHLVIQFEKGLDSFLHLAKHYPSVASMLKTTRSILVVNTERGVPGLPMFLAAMCPNITALELRYVDLTTLHTYPDMLMRGFARLHKLKHLKLDGCAFRNMAHIQRMFRAFPALDSLNLNSRVFWPVGSSNQLQNVYASPALTEVATSLVNWMLHSPSVRSLTLQWLDAQAVMECLAATEYRLETLGVWLHWGDDHRCTLTHCEDLHHLLIHITGEPHVLLSTLPTSNKLHTIELVIWGESEHYSWGRLAQILVGPRLPKLQRVVVRALPTTSDVDYEAFSRGNAEMTLEGLRDALRKRGVTLTYFTQRYTPPTLDDFETISDFLAHLPSGISLWSLRH